MKKGNPSPKVQKHVKASQKILRDAGIDVRTGKENLVWAPNEGHSEAYAKKVHDELKKGQDLGGKQGVKDALDSIGKRIGKGTFMP